MDLTKDLSTQERTYVVGLPVVITISAEGKVSIDVDLSEASDLDDAGGDLPNLLMHLEGSPVLPADCESVVEDQITEDEKIISKAIDNKVATIGASMLTSDRPRLCLPCSRHDVAIPSQAHCLAEFAKDGDNSHAWSA